MNDDKRLKEIKKEDRKKMPIFFIVMVLSLILGYIIGGVFSVGDDVIDKFFGFFTNHGLELSIGSTVCMYLLGIIATIISIPAYVKLKKLWNKEDERDDNWEYIENGIEKNTSFLSICLIFTYFFFAGGMYNLKNNLYSLDGVIETLALTYERFFFVSIVGVGIFTAVFFTLQRKNVELEKLMNPERKGSLYDFSFTKKWSATLDEAELKQVGVAAYKAFNIVNATCMVMMIILMVLGMFVEITMFPVITVTIIWLAQIIAFSIESNKAIANVR